LLYIKSKICYLLLKLLTIFRNKGEIIMRTVMYTLMTVLVLVTLVGCGGTEEAAAPTGYAPGQTVEAYDYVHGGYVGKAEVSTTDDGNFEVTLDEAFLPHTLAVVDAEASDWNENNTVTYTSHGRQSHVAKYVVYNDTTYVGTTFGTSVVWVEADEQGNPAGNTSLEMAIIRNEETMRAYYNGIGNGAFQVLTGFDATPQPVETTSYGSLYKRGSEYWAEGGHGLGWNVNIEAIQNTAQEAGVSYSFDEISKNNDDVWKVADTVSGATASDFKEYFALVQLAVSRLERQ